MHLALVHVLEDAFFCGCTRLSLAGECVAVRLAMDLESDRGNKGCHFVWLLWYGWVCVRMCMQRWDEEPGLWFRRCTRIDWEIPYIILVVISS